MAKKIKKNSERKTRFREGEEVTHVLTGEKLTISRVDHKNFRYKVNGGKDGEFEASDQELSTAHVKRGTTSSRDRYDGEDDE